MSSRKLEKRGIAVIALVFWMLIISFASPVYAANNIAVNSSSNSTVQDTTSTMTELNGANLTVSTDSGELYYMVSLDMRNNRTAWSAKTYGAFVIDGARQRTMNLTRMAYPFNIVVAGSSTVTTGSHTVAFEVNHSGTRKGMIYSNNFSVRFLKTGEYATLDTVNSSAQINRSQVNGQESVDTTQNSSISGLQTNDTTDRDYVNATFLPFSGGTMTGDLNFNGYNSTNVTSCDASYCIGFAPWNSSLIRAINGSTGNVDYSGNNESLVLQNTINSMNEGQNRKIIIKEGEYNFRNINIAVPGIIIQGNSPFTQGSDANQLSNIAGTIINIESNDDVFILDTSGLAGFTLKDIVVNGSARAYNGTIINATKADRVTIDNVYVYDHAGETIHCRECWDWNLNKVTILRSGNLSNNKANIRLSLPPTNRQAGRSSDWDVYSLWMEAMGGEAINDTAGSQYFDFFSPKIHGSTSFAYGNITSVYLETTHDWNFYGGLFNYANISFDLNGSFAIRYYGVAMGANREHNIVLRGNARVIYIDGYQGTPTNDVPVHFENDAGYGVRFNVRYDSEPLYTNDGSNIPIIIMALRAGTPRYTNYNFGTLAAEPSVFGQGDTYYNSTDDNMAINTGGSTWEYILTNTKILAGQDTTVTDNSDGTITIASMINVSNATGTLDEANISSEIARDNEVKAITDAMNTSSATNDTTSKARDNIINSTKTNKSGDAMTGILTQNGSNLAGTAYNYQSWQNLLKGGDFEVWSAGTTSSPDGWDFAGVGGNISRSSTNITGTYSASITNGAGNVAYLQYGELFNDYYKVRTVTAGAWVWADAASRASLRIVDYDGSPDIYSAYHNGNSTWQFLTVTYNVPSDSADFKVRAQIYPGDSITAYFDGILLVEGNTVPSFSQRPLYDDGFTIQINSTTNNVTFGGSIYVTGDMSALTITDRTPYYEGDALSELALIKGNNGQIDHHTLPPFVQVKRMIKTKNKTGNITTEFQDERNIGNLLSMHTVGINQLNDKYKQLFGEQKVISLQINNGSSGLVKDIYTPNDYTIKRIEAVSRQSGSARVSFLTSTYDTWGTDTQIGQFMITDSNKGVKTSFTGWETNEINSGEYLSIYLNEMSGIDRMELNIILERS